MNSDPHTSFLPNWKIPLEIKIFNPDRLTLDTPPPIGSQKDIPIANICPPASVRRHFVSFLARGGDLNNCGFSVQSIKKAADSGLPPKGFSVRFLFPPNSKNEYDDYANLCLMENCVIPLWDSFVPRLMNNEISVYGSAKKRKKYSTLSKVPFVMRIRDFKVIRDTVMRKSTFQKTSTPRENILSKLVLYPLPSNGTLLLRKGLTTLIQDTNLHPMVVEIQNPTPERCRRIKKEYIDNKQTLVRQLAAINRIPGLMEAERLKAIELGSLPDGYPYSCHHMVPRILGGTNALHNLSYINNSLHKHIHKLIRVYEEYLSQAPQTLRSGRLFAVLPMPADFNGPELRIIKDRFTILTAKDLLTESSPRKIKQHPISFIKDSHQNERT